MRLTILRGISGAGKSTWVKQQAADAVVCSADHFFLEPDGTYNFDGSRVHQAHQECYQKFLQALEVRAEQIVIDNSNIYLYEFTPYLMPAELAGYEIEILTLRCDPEVAIARKDWVPADATRRKAADLAAETKRMPRYIAELHRVIETY